MKKSFRSYLVIEIKALMHLSSLVNQDEIVCSSIECVVTNNLELQSNCTLCINKAH